MTDTASSKTSGSLTAKMFLIISGSCLIYLSLLAASIAAVAALFSKGGTGESLVITASRAFLNVLYVPTVMIVGVLMIAILFVGMIKSLGAIDSKSIKMPILIFCIFVLAAVGSVGPLADYRPSPTTAYLLIFALLVAVSMAIHIYLLFSKKVPLTAKVQESLLVIPYVILSVFSAMSLVQAMLLYIASGQVEVEVQKLCAGILSPLWAIACLFIPAAIIYWLGDLKSSQEMAGKESKPVS